VAGVLATRLHLKVIWLVLFFPLVVNFSKSDREFHEVEDMTLALNTGADTHRDATHQCRTVILSQFV